MSDGLAPRMSSYSKPSRCVWRRAAAQENITASATAPDTVPASFHFHPIELGTGRRRAFGMMAAQMGDKSKVGDVAVQPCQPGA